MVGLDAEFTEYYKKALQLDWGDLSLYISGGLLSNHSTTDIDAYIVGQDRHLAVKLMYQLQQIGPWDVFYTENTDIPLWYWDQQPIRSVAAYTMNGETLRWKVLVLPSLKMKMKKRAGYNAQPSKSVIQNGINLYF